MNPGKNKKKNRQNKPQNPNPPQNVESDDNVQVAPETAKFEERVPEIISEVLTLPVSQSKDGNDEPKKPKRNRGKKKPTDKDDIDDVVDIKSTENLATDNKNCEDSKLEPTAWKKKGKNKASIEAQMEVITSQAETKVESGKLEVDTQKNIDESRENTEVDIKPAAKKKNKKSKKNRTDSERSDKADELSCTSAFQKILQTKNEGDLKDVEKKDVDNVKAAGISDSSLSEPTVKEIDKNRQTMPKSEVVINLKLEEHLAVTQAESAKDDISKNKKKNKKDKKPPTNEEAIINYEKSIEPKTIIKPDETIGKTVIDQSTKKKDIKEVTKFDNKLSPEKDVVKTETTFEETITKPKAKIAKPVEKKGKGKQTATDIELKKTDNVGEVPEKLTQLDFDEEYSKVDVFSTICETSKSSAKEAVQIEETIISEISKIDTQTDFDKEFRVLDVFKPSAEKNTIKIAQTITDEIAPIKTPDIARTNTPEQARTPVVIKENIKTIDTEHIMKADSSKFAEKTEYKDVGTLQSVEKVKPRQKKGKGKDFVPNLEDQIKLADVFESISAGEDHITEFDPCFKVEEPFEMVKPRQKKGKDKHEHTEQLKASEVQDFTPKPANIEKTENIFDVKEEIAKPRQKKNKNKNFLPDFVDPIKLTEIPESTSTETTDKYSDNLVCIAVKDINQSISSEKDISVTSKTTDISAGKTTDISTETTDKYVDNPVCIDVKVDVKNINQSISTEKDKFITSKTTDISAGYDESKNTENMPSLISIIDNMNIPEDKTGKKRKKSPKPSKISEKLPPVVEIPITDIEKNVTPLTSSVIDETSEIIKTVPTSIQKSIPEVIYSGNDKLKVDINPVMTQSTGSEITPDLIEHPRSTSADVIDGNNNMMIQEMYIPESVFNMPFDISNLSYVQGSGETELTSPIVIATCVRVDELETKTEVLKEPIKKTDLKSQVMEVNKDMEDLRLSIERSLAEFTAIEKKEEEIEKNYEDTHPKSIDIKSQDAEIGGTPKMIIESLAEQPKHVDLPTEHVTISSEPPVCPARKDNKGKSKSKKKGKQDSSTQIASPPDSASVSAGISTGTKDTPQESKKDEKTDHKDESKSTDEKEKGKQQSSSIKDDSKNFELKPSEEIQELLQDFDPIENFEDALTSSVDDVNKTFEIIAEEALNDNITIVNADKVSNFCENPELNITESDEKEKAKEKTQQRENPLVSQPKNLLGHPVIPARSNKTDFKKEKNKTPNSKQAKVKIKDFTIIDKDNKQSKECQTESKPKFLTNKGINESVTCVTSENDEYVYKYSFRRVFLSSNCHVCKKELKEVRVACNFCHLTFYCSQKHKDEDYAQHQALCFAVSTIVHLKGQKHIYAGTAGVVGHNYRLLRMQAIVSCERILKRRLVPWEQEALLYPRVCADGTCREWRQGKLRDCQECRQISYCMDNPDHYPKTHTRWCKSYSLYQKLVVYQLTRGRLEPKLPGRLLTNDRISDNINRLLADMYDEKIDMNDIQYAALTQLSTAPLTAVFSYQLYRDKMRQIDTGDHKKNNFTIHVVGAELQFEADSLNKWETFFLHLRPDLEELKIVLVGPDLNPSNLPLDLLGKVKLCPTCRVDKRRIKFFFHDKQLYHEYWSSDDFLTPNIVCAFNPSINRTSTYDDTWSSTVNCIFKQKVPFLITAYSMNEIQRDYTTIKTCADIEFNTVSEAKFNPYASVRPDRNFITDDEIPLLFKNYVYMVLIGAF